MRRLLSIRRQVPLDRADDYLLAWKALERAVRDAGGRAWIFRGAANEDRFLEFIEWTDDIEAPVLGEAVSAALAQLDSFAAGGTEEWEEA